MTHFEYELAFRVVIGLAGCAMALVAVVLDWRETEKWYPLQPSYYTTNVATNGD